MGYRTIALDTLGFMDGATVLYRRLGFVEIGPYYDNPMADAVFMERSLQNMENEA